MARTNKRKTNTINSVDTACSILLTLKELNGPGVTEIAAHLNQPKSTIYNHLQTLSENGLVVKKGENYRLSLQFLDIAKHVRGQIEKYDIIKSELDNLAEVTGEVAQFGIEEHGEVCYLYKKRSDGGVETASSIGQRQEIHSTALGKVLLAYMPHEQALEIINQRELPKKTENTISNPGELFEELKQIKDQGYASDDEENVRGIRCVAAPVTNDDGIFGAVSVTGPVGRIHGTRFETELPEQVQSTANVMEINARFSE